MDAPAAASVELVVGPNGGAIIIIIITVVMMITAPPNLRSDRRTNSTDSAVGRRPARGALGVPAVRDPERAAGGGGGEAAAARPDPGLDRRGRGVPGASLILIISIIIIIIIIIITRLTRLQVFRLARPTLERPFIPGLLDPCTNDKLEPNIPAEVLYDKADNGLKAANPWEGKCVIPNLIIIISIINIIIIQTIDV